MSTVEALRQAIADLTAALERVSGVRHYEDPGATVDPPGTTLGAPALSWEAGGPGPTEARWLVYLVVAADEYAVERLWELLPVVTEALDELPNAAVQRADPGAYLTGGGELPCYEIQVDVTLGS